jgi:hypothetical protein
MHGDLPLERTHFCGICRSMQLHGSCKSLPPTSNESKAAKVKASINTTKCSPCKGSSAVKEINNKVDQFVGKPVAFLCISEARI